MLKTNTRKEKTKSILLVIATAFFSLTSCESEEFGKNLHQDEVEASFTTTISNYTTSTSKTRATGNTWHENDAIGILALSNNEIYNSYSNVKYVTPEEGTAAVFTAATDKIMFPYSEQLLNFIAYYPYTPTLEGFDLNIDLSNQNPLSDIDIMYATKEGCNYENPNVAFEFSHKLSQLQMQFISDEGIDLEGATISIRNATTDAIMNLEDGVITNGTIKKSVIPITTYSTVDEVLTATSILLPGQDLNDLKVIVKLSDESIYTWEPDEDVLIPNTRRIYSLKLTHSEVELESTGSTIEDWDEEVVDSVIDINPTAPEEIEVEPIVGDGTEESPYSVEQAIQNQGKDSVWVEGYVLGFAIDVIDGNFTLDTEPIADKKDKADKSIVLGLNNSETDIKLMLPVNITTSYGTDPSIYDALNLKTNSQLIGKRVKIRCRLAAYYSKDPGGRNVTDHHIYE